ncbi:hypothetical protein AKJ37_00665 [candidate division MSBL1 archaeon SCGC-AAA259I09]|uniref:Zinc-ribbon domain-containing protein n=1 Tax=candidate division MSBL1 archaeon SCGC-AAA259I09 TaxID=1698267 RepID=A0A133UVQ3_9EURY|nr:hypothetical protein AKJ37_00665 [candidate division MSBL1 archaeon SCGC-AAA259I09]
MKGRRLENYFGFERGTLENVADPKGTKRFLRKLRERYENDSPNNLCSCGAKVSPFDSYCPNCGKELN